MGVGVGEGGGRREGGGEERGGEGGERQGSNEGSNNNKQINFATLQLCHFATLPIKLKDKRTRRQKNKTTNPPQKPQTNKAKRQSSQTSPSLLSVAPKKEKLTSFISLDLSLRSYSRMIPTRCRRVGWWVGGERDEGGEREGGEGGVLARGGHR